MLGEMGRAEDAVQEAWVRWQRRTAERAVLLLHDVFDFSHIVAFYEGRPLVAILLAVAGGRIRRVFFQADPARLKRVGLIH
jgi:hypothetical protein